MQFALTIPFDRPDRNGVVHSRSAVEKAVSGIKNLPLLYRGSEDEQSVVIGATRSDTLSVLWDDELQVCEVIVNGMVWHGGFNCIANEVEDGVVTDFEITAFGISK